MTPNTLEKVALTVSIQEALQDATRELPLSRTKWLPEVIKATLRERRKAIKRARTTLAPIDKGLANMWNNKLRKELNEFRQTQWHDMLVSLNTHDDSLWKMTRALRKENTAINRPLHGPNGLAYIFQAKARAHADHLENIFAGNDAEGD